MNYYLQAQNTELEGACRNKDERLTVKAAEVQKIPMLRTQLEELNVKTSLQQKSALPLIVNIVIPMHSL